MTKQESLYEIQKCNFAAYDLLLYLDTHPLDKKAFEMFKELVEKLKKLKCEYEKNFGPLEAYNSAAFGSFKWIDSPWPWEREANI